LKSIKKLPVATKMHPTLAWFKELFEAVYVERDALKRELEKARSEYPKLTLAYKLTASYSRFLEKTYLNLLMRTSSTMPMPDDVKGGRIIFPPIIEAPDVIQELEEYTAGILSFGAEFDAAVRSEARVCPIIKQDYRAAANCVKRYLETPPQTDQEWSEYNQCIYRLSVYASEMESHNCSF
jgi:hypothetical protein